MKRFLSLAMILTAGVLIGLGCGRKKEVITIKGSDTMVILGQRWAELYMAKFPERIIQVTGGGSGTGISALINGTTDICNSSRPMKQTEIENLKKRHNTAGVEVKVAKDGISVYVHEGNPVNELTIEDVREIYLGKKTNWKEFGGPDAKIITYGRENNSGTYMSFKDIVLEGKDFANNVQSLPGTASVVNAVSKDANSIGFGGAAFGKGVKFVKIKKDKESEAYAPDMDHIMSGQYPLSRFLYMYLRERPAGNIKEFIDWVLSAEGQSVVNEVGYFPLR